MKSPSDLCFNKQLWCTLNLTTTSPDKKDQLTNAEVHPRKQMLRAGWILLSTQWHKQDRQTNNGAEQSLKRLSHSYWNVINNRNVTADQQGNDGLQENSEEHIYDFARLHFQ